MDIKITETKSKQPQPQSKKQKGKKAKNGGGPKASGPPPKGTPKQGPWGGQPRQQKKGYSAPQNFYEPSPKAFLDRSGKAPVHKDWGVGTRLRGCSFIATIGTTNASNVICNTVSTASNLDIWNAFGSAISIYSAFNVHPFNIPRLSEEALMYSRYAFRRVRIIYHPLTATTTANGLAMNINRDVTWPLRNLSDGVRNTIVNSENSVIAPFWVRSVLDTGDHRGDKTWTMSYPLFDNVNSSDPGNSFFIPYLEDSVQFLLTTALAVGAASATDNKGYLFIEYTADFYSPIFSTNIGFQPILLASATLTEKKPDPKDLKRAHRYAHIENPDFRDLQEMEIQRVKDELAMFRQILSERKASTSVVRRSTLLPKSEVVSKESKEDKGVGKPGTEPAEEEVEEAEWPESSHAHAYRKAKLSLSSGQSSRSASKERGGPLPGSRLTD